MVRKYYMYHIFMYIDAWLAQLGKCRSAEREVVVSNPGQTNTQGLLITERKVLPLVFLDKNEKQ